MDNHGHDGSGELKALWQALCRDHGITLSDALQNAPRRAIDRQAASRVAGIGRLGRVESTTACLGREPEPDRKSLTA